MPVSRRTFIKGIMDQDTDERLLGDGVFREAENILVINSEGSDVGAIENALSNKQLTNVDFGSNPKCLLGLNDEFEDKLYWFVKSDYGCFLLEWDNQNEIISFVLKDTRPENTRVLKLNENNLITGISKIINEDYKKNILLWTDDNMQPCCINIERAKSYGENNFELEDILLIKKPPRYAPITTPAYTNDLSNNIEEKFLTFSYRYKYIDGEYSALSDYTNYNFNPKKFELDYFSLDNIGMVNSFNAVKIQFNTGDKRVTDIQLVVKNSNSNNLYIIETFNKKNKGWSDNQTQSYIFSNSKLYSVLPIKELYRSFDNVPLKAKALTVIGNRIVFGNYLEGRNLVDKYGEELNINYNLSIVNEQISEIEDLLVTFPVNSKLSFSNPTSIPLEIDKQIAFNFSINLDTVNVFNETFFFIIERNYNTINELFLSIEFGNFMQIVNNNFINNYNLEGQYSVDPNYNITTDTSITFALLSGFPTFTVNPVVYEDTANSNAEVIIPMAFDSSSNITISQINNSNSCKTLRNYEVGIVYQDAFNRRTTVLTSEDNTIFIPQYYSVFKNSIRVTINSVPPVWADRYKLVVKCNPLQYQTIYVNEFYNENNFVWAKLQGENKDKVEVGDFLVVKKAGEVVISEPQKVKVLEIATKERNFIDGNIDQNLNAIIETSGVYMKIRPNGFSMDLNDYSIYQSSHTPPGSSGFPVWYLDLFTVLDTPNKELFLNQGSSLYFFINSNRRYDAGWENVLFEKTFFTQRDYNSIEDWFNEVLLNGNPIPGILNTDGSIEDYKNNLELVRGTISLLYGSIQIFTPDPSGKLYLKIKGLRSGGSKGRKGYGYAKILVRKSSGLYVFETEPKQIENNIFYENEQTFDIIDGEHQGNNQNQDTTNFTPAIVDLNFFNCYTQGNGVESYRIKDGFNKNYLNIDLRPSTTLVEKYKEIRRFADLTYSEPYIESTNINALNEFNISLANFKELDKQYGSIQKLHSRDNDILVLQEEKASKVLFGKDILFNADGSSNLSSIPEVLGQQITYLGENGISKNPESFALNDYQIFYTNAKRGLVHRLSIDGVTPIVNYMTDFFRDLFRTQPNSKKIGGYDPYHNQYNLSFGLEPVNTLEINCGNTIIKSNLTETFNYIFSLNSLTGDIILNINITEGNATIVALHDEISTVESNVSGLVTMTIPRTNILDTNVYINITPVTESISFSISNLCPTGTPLKIVEIVLNGKEDLGKTINNRYRWGASSYFGYNDIFEEDRVTRFQENNGIEGVGKFPRNGEIIKIESYKSTSDTGKLSLVENNKLAYLISSSIYNESDIDLILEEATFLSVSTQNISVNSEIESGTFLFNRANENEILYLIWEYCSIPYDFKINNFSSNEIYITWKGNEFCTLKLINLDTLAEIVVETNELNYLFQNLDAYTNYEIQLKPNCSNTTLILNVKTMITRKYGSFDIGDITNATNITGDLLSVTTSILGDWAAGHAKYTITFNEPVETTNYAPIIITQDKTGVNNSSLAFAISNKTINGFILDVRDVAVSSITYGLTQDATILIQIS